MGVCEASGMGTISLLEDVGGAERRTKAAIVRERPDEYASHPHLLRARESALADEGGNTAFDVVPQRLTAVKQLRQDAGDARPRRAEIENVERAPGPEDPPAPVQR